jgi:8-oxo-dGTP pyrophosphatase MutT (NUDIX family)
MMQSAAIPYQIEDGSLRVMLVTSRTRRRWILPKGKIGRRMLASRSAEREAFEEAGVLGRLSNEPIGIYLQGERLPTKIADGVPVQAYALEVVDELPAWKEMHLRERRWFPIKAALRAVHDPELRKILRSFGQSIKRQRHSKKSG